LIAISIADAQRGLLSPCDWIVKLITLVIDTRYKHIAYL